MPKTQSAPFDLTTNPDGPKLRVWWIPQVPMKAFEVCVTSFVQAKTLLETLAQYDLFQLANNIKPDYSNAGGLMVFEDGDWTDFETEDGDGFDTLTMAQCVELDAATAAKTPVRPGVRRRRRS